MRERILLASIGDVQGSIKANDAKCSAALVLHGLLFAGSLSIAPKFGSVFVASSSWQQVIVIVLLFVAAAAFVTSVYFLLRALRPYRAPGLDVVDAKSPGVFFPLTGDLGEGAGAWQEIMRRVDDLDEANVVTELARERVKLAYILQHESDKATAGYWALLTEAAAVVTFLVFAATIAATQAQ